MDTSNVTGERVLSVLAVATEWESRHGGLSTFNRELCKALVSIGHTVMCLVPSASESEVQAAPVDA